MGLDITQMDYFVNIVECGCNLSLAAKKIHISQSALSQFVTQFEQTEGLSLFHRKNGRLDGLTEAGEKILHRVKDILARYEELDIVIQNESAKQQGTIRLGIPSLILRVYFAHILPRFLLEHDHIGIQVIEGGGVELRHKFLTDDLNYAILIEPTSLDPKKYEQHIIQMDEYVAFVDKNHPLTAKEVLEWDDLNGYQLATFNKNFTTYQVLTDKLREEKVKAKVAYESSAWDYLVELVQGTEIVTILPAPIAKFVDSSRFTKLSFRDFIPFNIWMCRPYKAKMTEVEAFVYEEILKLFYTPMEQEETGDQG